MQLMWTTKPSRLVEMVGTPASSCAPIPVLPSFSPHPAFKPPRGDVLLQSADSTIFSVHRSILMEGSTVFSDMFCAPSVQSSSSVGRTTREDEEIIIVAEPGYVLDALLRFLYPLPEPTFDSLSDLSLVLSACIKYDIPTALNVVRRNLVSPVFLSREPLRVFAIACRFGLQEEACEASRATLRITLLDAPLCDELRYVSAYDYHRLLTLHRSRASAARGLLSLRSRNCPVRCSQCSGGEGKYGSVARWWHEFERRAKDELSRRPLTDIIFSMRFLSECANAGCGRCGTSILDSYLFMEKLKADMDSLPDTIEL